MHKNGVYSIWETIDGFIVKELRKTKEFFNKIGEAIAYVDVMNRSYSENVYNLEVKNNNNYFAKGILVHNCWEPLITAFVKRIVKPKMKVGDVGVYLGYYSLLMSHLMGDTGEVHAFEPSQESLDDLMLDAEINGYTNITPHKMAISNFDGFTDFDNNTFLLTDDKESKTKESVKCCKFDSLGIDFDFIKVDTDGFDGNVIDGAIQMIKRCGTVFLIEYFPQMWHRVGMKPSDFFHKLSVSNLNCYVLGLDLKMKDVNLDKLLKYPRIQHLTPDEILCSPFPDISLIVSSKNAMEIEKMLV